MWRVYGCKGQDGSDLPVFVAAAMTKRVTFGRQEAPQCFAGSS
jgi:hypothetical protein